MIWSDGVIREMTSAAVLEGGTAYDLVAPDNHVGASGIGVNLTRPQLLNRRECCSYHSACLQLANDIGVYHIWRVPSLTYRP